MTDSITQDPPARGTLIGLGGKLRAGKDAVGDYLAETYGYQKLGMSDALNEALLKLNPLIPVSYVANNGTSQSFDTPYRELHARVGYVEAKKNPEVRRLLQVLGTEVGRDMIDSDVWVKIAERKITGLLDSGVDVVITAIRFPNELDMVGRLGGLSVWIDRSDSKRLEGTGVGQDTQDGVLGSQNDAGGLTGHASENSVSADMFHVVVYNDGTLEDLYLKVDAMLT